MIKLKSISIIILVLLYAPLVAQQLSLDFDSDIPETKPSQLDIKGEIKDLIWASYSPSPLYGAFSNGTNIYKFQNNLVKSLNAVDWGEAYTYAYNNGLLQSESWAGSTTGYHLHKRNGNTLSIFSNVNLNKPISVITYDDYDRIVKVEKGTGVFEISYIDNSKNSKIKEKTEKIFMHDNKFKVKIMHKTSNTYSSKVWNNKKYKVETSVQTSEGININNKRITTTESYFDESERLVYSKRFKEDGTIIEEFEYYYKDDSRGNWIAKSQFQVAQNRLLWREQRQITYSDGLVTGRSEINKGELNNLALPNYKNQYFFKKNPTNGNFWLYDNTGVYLFGETGLNNFLGTYNVYSIDLTNNSVIELTNFANIKDDKYYPAKVTLENNNSFVVSGNDGNFRYVINGVMVHHNNLKTIKLFNKELMIFDSASGNTYLIYEPKNKADIFYKMHQVDASQNGAYYIPFKTKDNKTYYVFIENGEAVNPTKETFIMSGKNEFVKTNLGYYKVENFASAKHHEILLPKIATEAEFNDAKASYDKLMNYKIPEKSTTTNVSVATTKTEPSSYFGCGADDGNCLVNYFNNRAGNLMKQGKTKDEASKLAGNELDQVFNANPDLGYYVIMKINQEHMIGIMGGLSKETRSKLRAMAMSEVKAYEDKYGTKKIKTVPYKPKKDNNN